MKTPRLIFLSAGGLFSGSDASRGRGPSAEGVLQRLRELRGKVPENRLKPLRALAMEIGAARLADRMSKQSGRSTPSEASDKFEFYS